MVCIPPPTAPSRNGGGNAAIRPPRCSWARCSIISAEPGDATRPGYGPLISFSGRMGRGGGEKRRERLRFRRVHNLKARARIGGGGRAILRPFYFQRMQPE